jgi:8-oxo-dGTP pyrophosphatase MutT (NUDIX family)
VTVQPVSFAELAARLDEWPEKLPPPPRALQPVLIPGRAGLAGLPDLSAGAGRVGAVLVLIYPGVGGEAHVLLTERPTGELRHSGEISLPGGALETTDASIEAAALREAAEETGLDAEAAGVRVVGGLESVDVRVSGFSLMPVVAIAERRPVLRADPREVASILEVPLAHFLPGAPIESIEEERGGVRLRYGYFPVDGYRVWGATARILGQLGALVSERIGT